MEVRLLGSFELLLDGAPLHVPGAGERALLALLAGAGGRTISKDRLIDQLWGEALPANPRNALHLRVSKLRRIIGDALVSDPPGYRLRVGDAHVDATRFEQLVAARRHADALDLWRGPPLEEFADQAWARAEAARLAGLRATAVEEWIDERLAAGEDAGLVAELEQFVAADPLRERLRGQLMTALYRCGRATEALAVYQDLYRLLDEELGLAPSVPLRRLQEAILRQDVTLDAAGVTRVRGNLPSPLTSVVGRDPDVHRLLDLSTRQRLVTVTGPGGIGKTTVALAAARRAVDRHADGAWLVRLSGVRDPAGIPTAVADALGLPTAEASSVRQLVISWLAPRRALVVLDNCEHLIDACAQLVEALLAATGDGVRVIATSREALAVHGEVQMPVGPLAPSDAIELFIERAAAVRAGFGIAETGPAVRQICERLDGMPLAIELAAARISMFTAREIAARLDDRFRLLTAGPRTAEARHRTLRAAVEWSYELLTPAERTAFRRLAVFAGGWTLTAAEAVCAIEGDDVLDLLDRLVRQSLVVADGSRFRMLETIRVYAVQRLADDGDAAFVRERHARFFTDLAEAAESALRGPEQSRWLTSLHAEDANLRLALAWAREHADAVPDVGLRLAGALGWYWYVGRQVDGRAQLTATLAAAAGSGSEAARARALQALSLALRPAGCIVHPSVQAADAAEESRALFATVGERGRAALSQLLTAVEAVAGSDVEGNLAAVADARRTLQASGDAWGAALADFVEMEVMLHHGSTAQALALGRRASDEFDVLADTWGRSAVRLHLGVGLRLAGRTDEADAMLHEAVRLSRDRGLPNNLARSLIELGETALHRGNPTEADRWLADGERLARNLADDPMLALVALARGTAARLRDDPEVARLRFTEALDRCERADVPRGVARALAGIAATALDEGRADAAVEGHLARARDVAGRIGDRAVLAVAVEQLARLAAMRGDDGGRERLLAEAALVRERHNRPRAAIDARDAQQMVTSGR